MPRVNTYYEHVDGYVVGVTTKGDLFTFDKEYLEIISKYTFYKNKDGYFQNRDSKKIHRIIMNPPNNMFVDHADGDKSNNRRYNLRVCTQQENNCNASPRVNTSSKYKGVRWHTHDKRWNARIRHNKKLIHLGNFTIEEEAALAYNEAAIKYFGEFARLNLIDKEGL